MRTVFERIDVDFATRGGTAVSWRLQPGFEPDVPHSYQLQVGLTPLDDADAWSNVGDPVEDVNVVFDPQVRVAGPGRPIHYRIVLTCPDAVHVSQAQPAYGRLGHRDLSIALERTRVARVALENSEGLSGWLLKRRRTGARPPSGDPRRAVVDPISWAVMRDTPTNETGDAYGTDRAGGYYAPTELLIARSQLPWGERVSPPTGTDAAGRAVRGWTLAAPRIDARDVFVHDGSDVRYEVGVVTPEVEVRGVPIVVSLDLHPLEPGHPAYAVPVPEGFGS